MPGRHVLLSLALVLVACPKSGGPPAPGGERSFVVLGLNDVYRIDGLPDGRGGLDRLRTLRRELEAEAPVLVLHGGDVLSPSLFSDDWYGSQMIEVLNLLDGDAEAFDEGLWAVFGNHEFDKAKEKHAEKVDERIEASAFRWLHTNIEWATDEEGLPLIEADNLLPKAVVEVGGVRVGLFGATIDSKHPAYVKTFFDAVETAKDASAALRSHGAEVVIGLTHLDRAEDKRILSTLGAAGPDLIAGGHDHVKSADSVLAADDPRPRWVLKGNADATEVYLAVVRVAADGAVAVEPHPRAGGGWHLPLGPDTPAPDPAVRAGIEAEYARFDAQYCPGRGLPDGCLQDVFSKAAVELVAEETRIRAHETNLGDWVADQALDAMAEQGAQIAFVNAGGLRLNYDVPAGTALTRRTVQELMPFGGTVHLVKMTGATLQRVVDRAVEGWPGSGNWLQIAGFAYHHDVEAGSASRLTLLGEGGAEAAVPISPELELLAVVPRFLLDPGMGDQDGYHFLGLDMVVADGPDLKELVTERLTAAGEAGIAPALDGRICSSDRPKELCRALGA